METKSTAVSFGGTQGVYTHQSSSIGTQMTFSVFVPPHNEGVKLPVLWYLSGLTCSHANVTEKGEFRRACVDHGIIFVAPDTSPRGEGVPDEPDGAYDFGLGAGHYVNATEMPWAEHYQMRDYIEKELPALIGENFPADMSRQGITGHSMGGHGALTIGLRNPNQYESVSAFAPIVNPMDCPWGDKALSNYLGADKSKWREYDSCALIEDGARVASGILVDQGMADSFLEKELMPERLQAACENAGQALTLRMQEGYDHSYYFISTFMRSHIEWHADRLKA